MLAEFLLERQRGGQTKEDSKNCRILGKVFANIKESVVVSVCIQVMTVPVLCQFFYGISPYAAIVNIIVIPCMGIMLGLEDCSAACSLLREMWRFGYAI